MIFKTKKPSEFEFENPAYGISALNKNLVLELNS